MTWQLAKSVSLTAGESGMVLLNKKSGRYYRLNRSGAEIVQNLLDGQELRDLVSLGETENPDNRERVSSDIETLIQELHQSGLLVEQ